MHSGRMEVKRMKTMRKSPKGGRAAMRRTRDVVMKFEAAKRI